MFSLLISLNRAVAPDAKSIENYAERRKQVIQESKYLGGDMEHTHLVKGMYMSPSTSVMTWSTLIWYVQESRYIIFDLKLSHFVMISNCWFTWSFFCGPFVSYLSMFGFRHK